MEDSEIRRSEIEMHGLSLIDVSSEDDSLLFSSFLDPDSLELSATCPELDKDDQMFSFLGEGCVYDNEETPVSTLEESHESPEPENLKSRNYNLRKSLAWDNAFFTNAGFLEPEELSSMIESNSKDEKKTLPTIEEDLQRSTESISSFEIDSTLGDSLELDLFDDIRASIQLSAKAYDSATSNKTKGSEAPKAVTSPSSNMEKDSVSQDKMIPKASPKKPSIRAQGLGKASKQTSSLLQPSSQSIAARGMNTSISKPSKVPSRVRSTSTTSMKRISMDVNKTKQEKDSKLAGGKQPLGPIRSVSVSSRPVIQRSTAPLKSSLRSSSVSKRELTSSWSSSESCISASSTISRKSPGNLIPRKKKNESSSRSTSSSSLANRSKGKPAINVSPATSISDLSSEASTPRRRGNGNDEFLHEGPKPTGLRLPSPKIGFFDGARNVSQTRSSAIPGLNRLAAKAKSEKLPLKESLNSKTKAGVSSRVHKKMFSKISAEEQLRDDSGERKNDSSS